MNEWISVKDRLCEQDHKVLILEKWSDKRPGTVHVAKLKIYKNGKKHWSSDYKIHFDLVTHWMPLPEPPK